MLGGFYAVMVLGFSIIRGTMGIINFAHGEFIMMGAYLTWIMNRQFGWEPFAAFFIVIPLMFFIGIILHHILIGRIIERPQLVSLLVTFALSIIMSNAFKLFFTATPRSVETNLSGFWRYGTITIPVIKTYDLLAALIMMAGLSIFLKYTRLGKSIRAAAQNREAARMVGIEISSVYTMTFAICIALTGAAGVLLSPIKPIWPFMGPPLTLKAFAITTMSGLSSVSGALLGSLALGLVEVFVATYLPVVGTNLGIVSSYVILVVVLAFRPQGLFGGLKVMDTQH